MSKLTSLFVALACVVATSSFAEDGKTVVGTWKLVSYEVETQATGHKGPVMGDKPAGYATFTPEQKAVVRDAISAKLARMEQFRAHMMQRHGQPAQ